MLDIDNSKGSEDEHWLARARYHLRMEEYWRDRAMTAERELEQMKQEKEVNQINGTDISISRCCF